MAMNAQLASRAGTALIWRSLQLIGGKTVNLIRTLILARLLAPDDFGLFAIAAIAIEVLLVVTNFGMGPALVQRERVEAWHYDAAWTISFLRGLAVGIVLLLSAPMIASLFHEPRAIAILQVLAIKPVIEAMSSTKVAELERELNFRPLAILAISSTAAGTIVSIVLAPALAVWALVVGALAGSLTGLAASYLFAPYRPHVNLSGDAAGSLLQFGRWVFLSGLVAVVGDTTLRAVISRQLDTSSLGLYYIAAQLALLPNDVVSSLVGGVLFPLHARIQNDLVRARKVFTASVVAMVLVLAPIYALLVVLAPSLVEHLLGPRWIGTEPLLRILAIAGLVGILFDATAPMVEARGQPYKVTWLFAGFSVVIVTITVPLVNLFGLPGAAWAWVLAQIAVAAGCFIILGHLFARPFQALARPLGAVAIAAAAAAVLASLVDSFLPGVIGIVAACAAGLAGSGGILWFLDRYLALGLTHDFAATFPAIAKRLQLLPGNL